MNEAKKPGRGGRAGRAARKTLKGFGSALPVFAGVLVLVSLLVTLVPRESVKRVFTGHALLDPLLGTLAGAFAAGNPVSSYVIAGELREAGVTLAAVTAFLVAWVSIGVVQLPAESVMLGKRFALTRLLVSLVCCPLVAFATVWTLDLAGW